MTSYNRDILEEAIDEIVFRNRGQVALFCGEITGQMSDGHWENHPIHSHWIPWCNVEKFGVNANEVGVVSENGKAKYHLPTRNYKLSNNQLLSVIGGRMLVKYVAAEYFFRDDIDLDWDNLGHLVDTFAPDGWGDGVEGMRTEFIKASMAIDLTQFSAKTDEQLRAIVDDENDEEMWRKYQAEKWLKLRELLPTLLKKNSRGRYDIINFYGGDIVSDFYKTVFQKIMRKRGIKMQLRRELDDMALILKKDIVSV